MSVTELQKHAKHYTWPAVAILAGTILALVSCGVLR